MGPHPLEHDQVSVRIPVWSGEDWRWCRIDADWYRRAMAHKWRLSKGYPTTTIYHVERQKATHIALHRWVAHAPAGVIVDHVRGDVLDARRHALRWATASQNSANARRFRPHSSRFRGVTKNGGRWQAQIRYQGKNHYLGLFADEADAAKAYDEAAVRFFGPFAITNTRRLRRRAA